MSKGGGGGGADTSGLAEATAQATALQKLIYEQTREDSAPWYNMGVGSVNMLSDLLGVSGGSVQDRGQIYDSLKDQYTTQTTTGGGMGGDPLYTDKYGNITTQSMNHFDPAIGKAIGFDRAESNTLYSPGATTTQSVDYDALNAAVDAQMSSQSTPDNFGSLLKRFDMDEFEADPGYGFRKDEANKALERKMAAQGVTLGGAGFGDINPEAYRATSELNQNLASQEYGNSYNRYVQDQLNTFNMLMGTAGMGQGSTGIMATAGQNYATNTGNLQTGLAGAQLNAQLADQAQQSSMFGSLLGTAGQLGGSYLFSDIRVKENISEIGAENGLPIYTFNYIGDNQTYKGVMAQDVEITHPDAVKEVNGLKMVDYDAIGVKMEAVQ